jgi:hypothetical protein
MYTCGHIFTTWFFSSVVVVPGTVNESAQPVGYSSPLSPLHTFINTRTSHLLTPFPRCHRPSFSWWYEPFVFDPFRGSILHAAAFGLTTLALGNAYEHVLCSVDPSTFEVEVTGAGADHAVVKDAVKRFWAEAWRPVVRNARGSVPSHTAALSTFSNSPALHCIDSTSVGA